MTLGNLQLWPVALVALLVGIGVLVVMVRYDLGPSSRLARGGQWLLATALGTGVLAFALKLAMIAAFSALPELAIDPLIDRPVIGYEASPQDPLRDFLSAQRLRWQSLPEGEAAAPIWTGGAVPNRNSSMRRCRKLMT